MRRCFCCCLARCMRRRKFAASLPAISSDCVCRFTISSCSASPFSSSCGGRMRGARLVIAARRSWTRRTRRAGSFRDEIAWYFRIFSVFFELCAFANAHSALLSWTQKVECTVQGRRRILWITRAARMPHQSSEALGHRDERGCLRGEQLLLTRPQPQGRRGVLPDLVVA